MNTGAPQLVLRDIPGEILKTQVKEMIRLIKILNLCLKPGSVNLFVIQVCASALFRYRTPKFPIFSGGICEVASKVFAFSFLAAYACSRWYESNIPGLDLR